MLRYRWKDIIDKHHWIHLLFWTIYSIYLFANPPLYKWGIKPVICTAIVFYISYGGGYLLTITYTSNRFFQKNKIGKGLLIIILTACVQQLIFGPASNYFLPFNNPFLEWFLFNLPFNIIILLMAAGVSVFTDYLYVVRKAQQLEITKAQQEIFVLKSQINPHFLFNTLNSLYSLARSKSDTVEVAILQLSELMRYLIEMSQREYVLVSDEIRFLSSYIEMEKLRLDEGASCHFNISSNNYDAYRISPLLLLPFVENAFKHGIESNPSAVDIQFYLAIQKNTLIFEVNNTLSAYKPESTTGTGLNNVRKRLELLYGKDFSLELNDSDNRFIVKLMITLK